MAIYYLLAAGLAGAWLAGFVKKNKIFGKGGSFHRPNLLIPTAVSVAAIFLASCAAAPAAVSTPAASAPTTVATAITNTSTSMPTVAPAAVSTGSTPSAGSTPDSPSSGSGAGATVYTIVPGKSTAQYSVREQLARLQLSERRCRKNPAGQRVYCRQSRWQHRPDHEQDCG